jgi:hypothetical protein
MHLEIVGLQSICPPVYEELKVVRHYVVRCIWLKPLVLLLAEVRWVPKVHTDW